MDNSYESFELKLSFEDKINKSIPLITIISFILNIITNLILIIILNKHNGYKTMVYSYFS